MTYPLDGPREIYALGVPASAKVVDNTPPQDVRQLIAGAQSVRRRFDDYCAVVVQSDSSDPRTPSPSQPTCLRIWRKGKRWRVEQCRLSYRNQRVPDDVDPKLWWHEQANKSRSLIRAISDGSKECLYNPLGGGPDPKDPNFQEIIRFDKRCSVFQGPIADDPKPLDHYFEMPEFNSHPHMYEAEPTRSKTIYNPSPGAGPEGTVFVEFRPWGTNGFIHRYWIDPKRSYVAMRQEVWKQVGEERIDKGDSEIVQLAQSPLGFWYPTIVRVNSRHYYHYHVMFETPIPDELFQFPTEAAVLEPAK
jgi:hypothetical protein